MKKLLLFMFLALLPLGAGATGTPAPGQAVTITERHVYLDAEGQQHIIPQSGAEKRHVLSRGKRLTLKSLPFPGLALQAGEAERRVLAQADEAVVFVYARTKAPVTANIRVETTAASNLPFLRERLAARSISLRARQETLASQPLRFSEEAGEALTATLTFEALYTHTLGGTPIAYRALMENLPEGFTATADGLTLTLRPVPLTLSVRHLYESAKGMEPIPQDGAAYEIDCRYGDTLLIPNQDFEGFLTDQETPNQYLPAVTHTQELSFFHRRRMGVYGTIEIDASESNRPARLLRLVTKENPVILSLSGKTVGSAVAQFSGQESMASVSFPHAYTHTPEGVPLAYTLSLVETPAGFLQHGEGTAIVLTPRPVSIHVTHQYAESPEVWAVIPQEGAAETRLASFGDSVTIAGKDFDGFAEERGNDRVLSQVTGEEEVFFQHVRSLGPISCTLRLIGGPDSNGAALLAELSHTYFTATGGELPVAGLRVAAELAGEEGEYLVMATLPGMPTHAPDGQPYTYSLLWQGFTPLAGMVQPFTDIRPNAPVSADMGLPEITVTCLLETGEGQAEAMESSYPYGETLAIDPPLLSGFTTGDPPLHIPFLREETTHTFHYQPDSAEDTPEPIEEASTPKE